ncbi:MAG: Spy/CpxP family protein refolding chaperone [Rhodospirillaceae bacterium]|jgi:periplasmic protein CpxP/Spy|nr:Spy/CpxP family protein refolding chaperone [Rhodospirillaceae bacterium]MBT6117566.1 Spy/CpxP family protein refolding chaperone [Rhodospirillaceae bacterium]
MADETPRTPKSGRSRGRWIFYAIAGLIGAVVGGTALTAGAHSDKDRGADHGGWGDHKKGPFAEKKIDFMLYQLDATAEQREAVKGIMAAAHEDMKAMRETQESGREAFAAALAKPVVDRQELESLRKSHLEAFDRMSARMVQAMADAAEVLTPEQRVELAEFAEKMDGRHSRH